MTFLKKFRPISKHYRWILYPRTFHVPAIKKRKVVGKRDFPLPNGFGDRFHFAAGLNPNGERKARAPRVCRFPPVEKSAEGLGRWQHWQHGGYPMHGNRLRLNPNGAQERGEEAGKSDSRTHDSWTHNPRLTGTSLDVYHQLKDVFLFRTFASPP